MRQVTVELRVLFDGPGHGLPEHRLSLATFAEPLGLLLAALQRTASGIVRAAIDNPDYGVRGGRLAAEAKLLDLELAELHGGCVSPSFVCTAHTAQGAQALLIDDLPEHASVRLFRDIDAEARGKLRSVAARRYLRSLPSDLSRQKYAVLVDGNVRFEAEFGAANLATIPTLPGRLVRRTGHVVAVGFEPTSVKLRIDGHVLTCPADEAQVEQALACRREEVLVAVIEDADPPRLVWLRSANEVRGLPSVSDTLTHLFGAWPETLRILGQ